MPYFLGSILVRALVNRFAVTKRNFQDSAAAGIVTRWSRVDRDAISIRGRRFPIAASCLKWRDRNWAQFPGLIRAANSY